MPRARKPKKPVESPRLPSEFAKAELEQVLRSYARATGLGSWTEESIVVAREAQAQGRFKLAAPLGRAIMSEPSIAKAVVNRLAPQRGLKRRIRSPNPLTGSPQAILDEAIATFTGASSSLPANVLIIVFLQLAIHEISIGQIQWEERADGSRQDAFLTNFDLEYVEWNELDRKLYAWTTEGRVEIVHGDGRWVVFTKAADRPWALAALLALAMLWADLAFGRKYRSRNAKSHGDDKWVGVLPEGVPIDSDEGTKMLVELLKMYEPQRAMLVPFGGTVKREEAMGQNWQIFKEQIDGGGKDASGILLGSDGPTQTAGGDYKKSWMLFGVRNDIVEGDLLAVGEAISTGMVRPWSIRNFKRWDRLEYFWLLPDADDDARRESIATRRDNFNRIVTESRAAGLLVDACFIDRLWRSLGLDEDGLEAPHLAPAPLNGVAPAAPATYPRSVA
jgi:hypothetical protein